MCLLGQRVSTGSDMSGEGGISGSKFDIEIFQCPNEETNKGRLGFGSQKWVLEYQIATYFEEVKHMKKKKSFLKKYR